MPDSNSTSETNKSDVTIPIDRRDILRTAGVGLGTTGLIGRVSGADGFNINIRQINRPEFPEVTLFASVYDSTGNLLSNLSKSDFTLTETRSGVSSEQAIETLTPPDNDEADNISSSVIIDKSNSMSTGTRMQNAIDGGKQFVQQFQSGDEGLLVAFNDTVDVRQRWTDSESMLTDAIDTLSPSGSTALFDAVKTGINEAAPRTDQERIGRSAVVVLADGQDNASSTSLSEAVDLAQQEGIPIYTIGLGNTVNAGNLEQLATETGGEYYRSADGSDLSEIYTEIAESITSEYRLTYITNDDTTDGEEREVRLDATYNGNSGYDTETYEEPCAPLPTASFTFSPDVVVEGQEVSFDGTASQPNGGQLVAHEWDFNNDGSVDATGETATHTYTKPGQYDIALAVEKTCGARDVEVKSIAVADEPVSVVNINTNAPITEGEVLEVELELKNTQFNKENRSVILQDFNGDTVDAEPVQVGRGETLTLTLEWDTEVGDAGTDDITVRVSDISVQETIGIQEATSLLKIDPASIEIEPYAVEQNEEPTVSATITGAENATVNVSYTTVQGNDTTAEISMTEGDDNQWESDPLPAVGAAGWVDMTIEAEDNDGNTETTDMFGVDDPLDYSHSGWLVEDQDLGYHVFEEVLDIAVVLARGNGEPEPDESELETWKRARERDLNYFYGSGRGLHGAVGFRVDFYDNDESLFELPDTRNAYENSQESIVDIISDMESEVSQVTNINQAYDFWLGIHSGGTMATVQRGLLNPKTYFILGRYNAPGQVPTQIEETIYAPIDRFAPLVQEDYAGNYKTFLHEIGHALGFAHPHVVGNDKNNCLMVQTGKGTNRHSPTDREPDSIEPTEPLSTLQHLTDTLNITLNSTTGSSHPAAVNVQEDWFDLDTTKVDDLESDWGDFTEEIPALQAYDLGDTVTAIEVEGGSLSTRRLYILEARGYMEESNSVPDLEWSDDEGGVVVYKWEGAGISPNPSYNIIADSSDNTSVTFLRNEGETLQDGIGLTDLRTIEFRLEERNWGNRDDQSTFSATVSVRATTPWSNTQIFALEDGSVLPDDFDPSLEIDYTTPTLDLKAVDSEGRMIGVNNDGEYVNEIPGAKASGKRVQGTEWIAIPEDIDVKTSVSAADIETFRQEIGNLEGEGVQANTPMSSPQEDLQTEFKISESRVGDDPKIVESDGRTSVSGVTTRAQKNEIEPGEERTDVRPSNKKGEIDIVSIAHDEPLSSEQVIFENTGSTDLQLDGWELQNNAGDTYTFPEGTTIKPGRELTVYSGSGRDSTTERHWNATDPVWNDSGDQVLIIDEGGTVQLDVVYDKTGAIDYDANPSEFVQPALSDYADTDSIIGRNGINEAVRDYLSGDIGNELVNEAIQHYVSGNPIK